jgi:hypothetical protein
MHPPSDPTLKKDLPKVLKTSIWRADQGTDSVIIDMTHRKDRKIGFLMTVSDQYPTRIGVLTQ